MAYPSENTAAADIAIDAIRVPAGRRRLDPAWVETLAWLISEQGQQSAIEVLAEDDGYVLIFGAHRVAAMKKAGLATIRAVVKAKADFDNEFQITLREITENLARRELSVLDRAVDIARWREIYDATHTINGRGRPKKRANRDAGEITDKFVSNFVAVAQQALDVTERTVFRALKIATIAGSVRERIALLPLADNQSELLALAAETPVRQEQIAALLTSEPPQAHAVAEAIAILDRAPKPARLERWQKLSATFSAMKPAEQDRFFDLHAEAIDRWFAGRRR